MDKEFQKTYQPREIEKKIYLRWEKSGFFNPDKLPGVRKKPYSISMPPPNVTGELHLGHATALTIEDLLIRYHRMKGDKALFLPGTDHAGIATQIVVEKLIKKEGLNRDKLGRAVFTKRVWEWKKKYGSRITEQIRQLGASCDWSREHFTMDETLTKAVQNAFIKLFNDGLIYRGNRIVNWCPRCASALSDLEVKHQETTGKLWHIRYPLFGSTKYIVVATTRPETMLGDTAVAVNPKDKRYKEYVGKTVILPLVNREIPIITDSRVDIKFGTGAVKVTPAHDHLDYEISLTHKLEIINVIGQDNHMTKEAGEFYSLSIQEARHEILKQLEREELLVKTTVHNYNLARCDRCGAPIEPLISKQWFIKTKPLAKQAIDVVKKGEISIIPKQYTKVYFHWMNNIRDWCISRQLWWGHQIPVWYCGGQENVPKQKMGFHQRVVPQMRTGKVKTYRLRDHKLMVGDKVVFENSQTGTIFGVGTIFNVEKTTINNINLQDPAHGATYKTIEELIKAFKFHHPKKKITAKTTVYIYSYKFTPQQMLEGCGEVIVSVKKPKRCIRCGRTKNLLQDKDTLDTWFSSGLWTFSTLGWPKKTKDLKIYHPTSVMETGWDILFFWVARMIMMSLYFMKEVPFKKVYLHGLVLDRHGKKMSKSKGTGVDPIPMMEKYGTDAIRLSLVLGTTAGQDFRLFEEKIAGYRNFINKLWNVSRFILSRDKKTQKPEVNTLADKWIVTRLQNLIGKTTDDIEAFRFSEAGTRIYEFLWHEFADWYVEIAKSEKNTSVLYYVLENILKLSHPFAPFVTEEIWSRWHGESKQKILMIQEWPSVNKKLIYEQAGKDFELIKKLIAELRNYRAERKIPLQHPLQVSFWGKNEKLIRDNHDIIQQLARVTQFQNEKKSTISGSLPGLDYYLHYEPEKSAVKKEEKKISGYIQKIEAKLSNKNFLLKAPKEIVEKVKQKLKEQQDKLKKLV